MTTEQYEEYLRQEAAHQKLRRQVLPRWATEVLHLHLICEELKCRRARRCALEETPCIVRYKKRYQHVLPTLRKALDARIAEAEAEVRAGERTVDELGFPGEKVK